MAKIVFLTGAGISEPSGLKTFRGSSNSVIPLWEEHSIDDVATFKGFVSDPLKVHHFYNQRRYDINNAKPNQAHFSIAELEKDHEVLVATQNIDDLHERAGSSNVIHIHGKHNTFKCLECGHRFIHNHNWSINDKCNSCGAIFSKVRPDIVWYEEGVNLKEYYFVEDSISDADIFVQVGTSAKVSTVSKLYRKAKRRKRVEINMERPHRNPYEFHHYYIGSAEFGVSAFCDDIEKILEYTNSIKRLVHPF